MKKENFITPFKIQVILEGKSHRVNVTHPSLRGRIRKRVGNGKPEEHESLIMHLKVELEKKFNNDEISKDAVAIFIDNYIEMHYKKTASIFSFFDEFIQMKERTYNKKTSSFLKKTSIQTYIRTKEYFDKYLVIEGIKPYPANINKAVLDGYFHHLKKKHNYKVKLHNKMKEYIDYISKEKCFPAHPSYEKSTFNEIYNSQQPEKDDIALTREQMQKLLEFRKRLYDGSYQLEPYKKHKCIPDKLQEQQRENKISNLKLSLDCFLFMCCTGMYHADITKQSIALYRSQNGVHHFSYNRAKNNSHCSGIPIADYGVFIAKTLMEEYSIQHCGNFPYPFALYTLDRHLKVISKAANLRIKLRSKWGRKTFATMLYWHHSLDLKEVQCVLGHKLEKDTRKYLRIPENDMADKIFEKVNVEL